MCLVSQQTEHLSEQFSKQDKKKCYNIIGVEELETKTCTFIFFQGNFMSISLDVTTGYITRKMTGTNDNDKFFIRELENYSKEEKYVRISISVFK